MEISFNPTLVRLRPGDAGPARLLLCSFNPTLVRLRPLAVPLTAPHKPRFNPTLVRLRRHRVTSLLCACRCSFNPTLVRLRPRPRADRPHPLHKFQSHAGSIEAPPQKRTDSRPKTFQSHAGSIEARPPAGPGRPGRPVSIPRWFD